MHLIHPLEPRLLFSHAPAALDYEQYLIELINRARANPSAEAARYHINLNEGLPPGTISSAPKQPLAFNPQLESAARKHSQWMIDHQTFAHEETVPSPNTPQSRMAAAGYPFTGSYTSGENLAERGSSGPIDLTAFTAQMHEDLFVDTGIESRGHRTNMLFADFREVGTGIVTGLFQGFNSSLSTEDFATTSGDHAGPFLTGVVYQDTVTADKFYTPGEGLTGVTLTATRTSDNTTYTTKTSAAGGYSLMVPAGTYTLTASGPGLTGTKIIQSITVAQSNVKEDFEASTATTQNSGGSTTGGSGGTTTTPTNPALAADFLTPFPSKLKPGQKFTVTIRLRNPSAKPYSGTLHPRLLLSRNTAIDPADIPLTAQKALTLTLPKGAARTLTFTLIAPANSPAANYHILFTDNAKTLLSASKSITQLLLKSAKS